MLRSEFTGATFELSKCPGALSPGIYEFGRSLLIHEDMRVSRSQVQLNVWPDRASITRVRCFSIQSARWLLLIALHGNI